MTLPTEKSKPTNNLSDYLVMIYGKPGVGKTTLAAQFENPLFCMFEPGAKSLSLYKKDIISWKSFVAVIDDLYTTKHNFKTIVLDTYPNAFEMCQQAVCKLNGWDHPQDGPFGKGWSAVYNEFSFQMTRLMSRHGVVLVAHAADKEIEQLDGSLKSQIAPDMTGQAFKFISRTVDVVAYYNYGKSGKRYIRVQATDDIMAKNRIDNHFKGITKFEAGETPEAAYKQFVAAFENKIEVKEKTYGEKQPQRLLFKRSN
jgi:phage nucleotide-binding protein